MADVVAQVVWWLLRAAIVALLLAMLPFALIGLAASGSTLSDPSASAKAGAIFIGYIALDVLALIAPHKLSHRWWVWLLSGLVAVTPITILFFIPWLRGEF